MSEAQKVNSEKRAWSSTCLECHNKVKIWYIGLNSRPFWETSAQKRCHFSMLVIPPFWQAFPPPYSTPDPHIGLNEDRDAFKKSYLGACPRICKVLKDMFQIRPIWWGDSEGLPPTNQPPHSTDLVPPSNLGGGAKFWVRSTQNLAPKKHFWKNLAKFTETY